MKLSDILHLELRSLRRSPAIALLFGIPLLYSLLFGCIYSKNIITYIPAVIYDQDQTATSRALVQAFADSERYRIVDQADTQEGMELALRENRALVAISIPPKFSQNIKLGMASEVAVTANSTNNMFANTVISSSQEIVQTFSVATGQKLLEAANQMPAQALRSAAPVKLGVRILNNPTTSYTNFMLAGLMANGVQIAILLTVGPLLTREYIHMDRWQNTSSASLILGKLLPHWLLAVLSFLTSLGVVTLVWGVPFRGSLLSVLLLGSAFTFLVTAISLLFSAIAKNEAASLQLPLLYIMPGLLFSGLSWPDFAMTTFSHAVSALMPLTYIGDSLRDLLLAGYAPALPQHISILLGSGTVVVLATAAVFSRRRTACSAQGNEGVSL